MAYVGIVTATVFKLGMMIQLACIAVIGACGFCLFPLMMYVVSARRDRDFMHIHQRLYELCGDIVASFEEDEYDEVEIDDVRITVCPVSYFAVGRMYIVYISSYNSGWNDLICKPNDMDITERLFVMDSSVRVTKSTDINADIEAGENVADPKPSRFMSRKQRALHRELVTQSVSEQQELVAILERVASRL